VDVPSRSCSGDALGECRAEIENESDENENDWGLRSAPSFIRAENADIKSDPANFAGKGSRDVPYSGESGPASSIKRFAKYSWMCK
jgi:hypothetical protein